MKVLVFGDVHIQANTEFSKPTEDGLTTHLRTCYDSLVHVAEQIEELRPGMVVNLGDFIDSVGSISESVLWTAHAGYQRLLEACAEVEVQTGHECRYYQLLGNHDYRAEVLRACALAFIRRDHLVSSPKEVSFLTGEKFLLLPYNRDTQDTSWKELLKPGIKYAFGHHSVVGARMHKLSSKVETKGFSDEDYQGLDLLINGHYHLPSVQGRTVYAGTLVPHSFDDQVELLPHGFHLLDTEDGSVQHHPNPHAYQFVDLPLEDVLCLEAPEKVYARVTYDATLDLESPGSVKELCSPLAGVRYCPHVTVGSLHQQEAKDSQDLVGEYVRKESPSDLVDDILQLRERILPVMQKVVGSRRVRVHDVSIRNFSVLGEVDFEFQDGTTLVLGKNEDGAGTADSNGAGKSSVFEAVLWCLYGESPKGAADTVVREGQKTCSVITHLTVDEDHYLVERHRAHPQYGTRVLIHLNGGKVSPDGIPECNKEIIGILGMDYEQFCQTVFLQDGLTRRFMSLSYADRIRVLEDVFSVQGFDAGAKVAGEEASKLDTLVSTIGSTISRLEGEVVTLDERVTSLQNQPMPDVSGLDRELVSLQGTRALREAEITEWEAKVSALREQANILQEEENLERKALIAVASNGNLTAGDLGRCEGTIQQIRSRLSAEESLVAAGKCPTCGQTCGEHTFNLDSRRKELEAALLSKKEVEGKIALDRQARQGVEGRLHQVEIKRKPVDGNIRVYAGHIQTARDGIRKVDSSISMAQSSRQAVLLEQTRRDESIMHILDDISRKQQEVQSEKEKLPILSGKQKVWSWWHKALGASGGMRLFVIQAKVDAVNQWLREKTDKVWSGGKIEMLHVSGKKLGVSVGGRKYEHHSRGERRRIDMVLQMLMNYLYRVSRGLQVEALWMDEVLDGLDETGMRVVLRMIEEVFSGMSVYVTSHNDALKSAIPRSITVIRRNGVSEVEA